MFTKGNKIYSEAFHYLKKGNAVSLKSIGNIDDFTEIPFEIPVNIEIKDKMIKFGTYFIVKPDNLSYESIKAAVIKMRYSNDDQIAIMLNKDNSEEDNILYTKMQEWREFASIIAKSVTSTVTS